MLGLRVALYGLVRYHFPNATLALLMAVALLALGGVPRLKSRFGALVYAGPRPALSDYGAAQSAGGPALVPLRAVLDRTAGRTGSEKHPLILVCASGGGIRAASWTCAMLRELETAYPGLPLDCGAIAGASGGMVGASLWTAGLAGPVTRGSLSEERKAALELAHRQASTSRLTALTSRRAFWGVPLLA